ncbi:MAG TPA: hypothetical protein K8V95_07325 [Staphylococcus arlettae]|nr:hypothetical protein [Staphylococcus arlettae]
MANDLKKEEDILARQELKLKEMRESLKEKKKRLSAKKRKERTKRLIRKRAQTSDFNQGSSPLN